MSGGAQDGFATDRLIPARRDKRVATVSTPVEGTTAANIDLGITKTAANNNAAIGVGTNETYTLTVTNHGNATANGVIVTDALLATVNFVSGTTSVSGVDVTDANGALTANLGSLTAGSSATVTLTVTPTVAGAITDTAYVEANETDTVQSNNSASITTNVVSAGTTGQSVDHQSGDSRSGHR